MDDLVELRQAVTRLLDHSKIASTADLATAIEKATDALRLFMDQQKLPAEQRRLALEEQRLHRELNTAAARERSDRIRDYVAILAPIVALLTLAGSMAFQSVQSRQQAAQFRQTEQDKFRDLIETEHRAKMAEWNQSLKTISDATNLSPVIPILQRHLDDPDQDVQKSAREESILLAVSGDKLRQENDLLGTIFSPPSWHNLPDLLTIDRGLATRANPIFGASWSERTKANNLSHLGTQDRIAYRYFHDSLIQVSAMVASVLKSPGPRGVTLDLSGTYLPFTDLSGVDLHAANLNSVTLVAVDLSDASLDEVKEFKGLTLHNTAWWQAGSISHELLSYLVVAYPCPGADNEVGYGPRFNHKFDKEGCDREITRLMTSLPRFGQ